jgi:hypothetical protein
MSASDKAMPGGQPSITQPIAGTVRFAEGGNGKQLAKCIAGHGRESLKRWKVPNSTSPRKAIVPRVPLA